MALKFSPDFAANGIRYFFEYYSNNATRRGRMDTSSCILLS